MALLHFLHTFNVPLFVPLPYIISGFIKFSTHRNKFPHKAIFFLLVNTACSTAASFAILFCQSRFDFLAQPCISCSHCIRLSSSCNVDQHSSYYSCNYFAVFFCQGHCVALLCFRGLDCHAICFSSFSLLLLWLCHSCRHHFYCCAILTAIFIAVPFSLLPSILSV